MFQDTLTTVIRLLGRYFNMQFTVPIRAEEVVSGLPHAVQICLEVSGRKGRAYLPADLTSSEGQCHVRAVWPGAHRALVEGEIHLPMSRDQRQVVVGELSERVAGCLSNALFAEKENKKDVSISIVDSTIILEHRDEIWTSYPILTNTPHTHT